jgi:chromate transport protein ChrA
MTTVKHTDFARNWQDIAANLLKLGATAYGGPAIMGIMQTELQEKRQWVSKERFVGLLGGLCFVLPGFFILLALTMGYAALGCHRDHARRALWLGPVVLGIHLVAVYRLGMAPHALPDVFAAATLHAHARHGVVSHVLNPAVR